MVRGKREDKLLVSVIQYGIILIAIGYAFPNARPVIGNYGMATAFALVVLVIGQTAWRKHLRAGPASKARVLPCKSRGALRQLPNSRASLTDPPRVVSSRP